MASINQTKGSAVNTNQTRITRVKDILKTQLTQHFSATLLREPDIVNIVSALIFYESGYDANAIGGQVSYLPGTGGADYMNSSAITAKFSDPSNSSIQVTNLFQGLRAFGLMQVMGWNIIRGGSPVGKSEIERLRPDLAAPLLINPGDSVVNKMLGEANLETAILAGLIVLEGKYRAVKSVVSSSGTYFTFSSDPNARKFVSKIQAAVSAYLGLGKKDKNGTTPEAYASSILGGSAYAKANGPGSLYVRDSEISIASSAGPSSNGTNLAAIKIPGCSA